MTSQGPNSPASATDLAGPGGGTWSNVTNVKANDTSYATVTIAAQAKATDAISATNYGFTIPSTATINGVMVAVFRHANTIGKISDAFIDLTSNGTSKITGSNTKTNGGTWPTTDTESDYGSSTDMWGLTTSTLTPTIINGTNFGVLLGCQQSIGTGVIASVNYISITVYYTPAGSTPTSNFLMMMGG